MEIKKKYGEFTKAELFNISQGANCTLLKNVEDNKDIIVEAAVIMIDETVNPENGEIREKEILHLKTPDGILTTESPTVIRTFTSAADFMSDHHLDFVLMRGKSKNNRTFMDLILKGVLRNGEVVPE